jgi:hypothetical protein
VKLIGTDKGQVLLQFGRRERELLLQLLQLYPRMPPAHHKLSKNAKLDPSNQKLLDEALAEQRSENRRQVSALVTQSNRWKDHQSGWRLALAPGELEWLLQVLNDIRVGSWVLVGSPEEQLSKIDEHTAPHLWAMEIAGSFEMALLQVLENQL